MIDDREVKIAALHVACDAFTAARARLDDGVRRYAEVMLAPHTYPADALVDAIEDVRAARREMLGWVGVIDYGARELARGFVDAGAGV